MRRARRRSGGLVPEDPIEDDRAGDPLEAGWAYADESDRASSTSSSVSLLVRTSPAPARAAIRAAMLTVLPNTSPS